MSADDRGVPLKPGESFRARLTPEQAQARAAAVHAKVQRATAVAEQAAGGPFPGSKAFVIGVLFLLAGGASSLVHESMLAYFIESGEAVGTEARFLGLFLAEVATVLFYVGLAALLAGAIRYGVAR